MLELFFKFY